MSIEPYVMAACRVAPQTVFVNGSARCELINANIDNCIKVAQRAADCHGARLIVFPQFGITGYAPVSPDAWHDAALEFPGPELDRIGAAARRTGSWIAVQAPERHPAFPGRHFLSCAIVDPSGATVLVHRKSYSLSMRTSPIDVYSKFVEAFGEDSFFPVVETAIGRLGALIGAEVHWPEPCRSLTFKGADLIVNPIAASPLLDYMKRAGAQNVRSVRAFENMVYMGTANIDGGPTAPLSAIYDYKGADIGKAAALDDDLFLAEIDILALRAWREQPSANFLAQIQADTTVHPNANAHWPKDNWRNAAPSEFAEIAQVEADIWRRAQAAWVMKD